MFVKIKIIDLIFKPQVLNTFIYLSTFRDKCLNFICKLKII